MEDSLAQLTGGPHKEFRANLGASWFKACSFLALLPQH